MKKIDCDQTAYLHLVMYLFVNFLRRKLNVYSEFKTISTMDLIIVGYGRHFQCFDSVVTVRFN